VPFTVENLEKTSSLHPSLAVLVLIYHHSSPTILAQGGFMKLLLLPLSLLFLSVACSKTPEDVSQQRAEATKDFREETGEARKDFLEDKNEAREELNEEMKDAREEMQDIRDESSEDYLDNSRDVVPRDEDRRIDAVE
jgi:septal ring factor EnvC (AmiA/AmiB activator)